jgi:glycoside/pentoside/hexuronide:cation symporter, GPH family
MKNFRSRKIDFKGDLDYRRTFYSLFCSNYINTDKILAKEPKNYPHLLAYGAGMAGWSVMMNIFSVMIIYFYLPPIDSGLPVLIPQIPVLGVFTLFSLVLASGRVFDAVINPLIAWLSDRSDFRKGRRIPFMAAAVIPVFVFCILVFLPLIDRESVRNYYWLIFAQAGFYISLTLYGVPYNALMPELAKTKDQKLIFSTVLSLMFVSGIIISSQIPLIATLIRSYIPGYSAQDYYRLAIAIVAFIGFILMLIPVFSVNEKKYCISVPLSSSLWHSMKSIIRNRNFLVFLAADASFFLTLAVLSSGILFYVEVLLGLNAGIGSTAIPLMVLLSLACYPLVVRLARKFGKRLLIVVSFLLFAVLFLAISGYGKTNLPALLQLYSLAVIAAFPVAVLGILPFNIVAELAEEDGRVTGEQKEGMFYAAKTFADMLGQTLGVVVFSVLTIFGKDPGHDTGIRLSALFGMAVALFAAVIFLFFREIKKGSSL